MSARDCIKKNALSLRRSTARDGEDVMSMGRAFTCALEPNRCVFRMITCLLWWYAHATMILLRLIMTDFNDDLLHHFSRFLVYAIYRCLFDVVWCCFHSCRVTVCVYHAELKGYTYLLTYLLTLLTTDPKMFWSSIYSFRANKRLQYARSVVVFDEELVVVVSAFQTSSLIEESSM